MRSTVLNCFKILRRWQIFNFLPTEVRAWPSPSKPVSYRPDLTVVGSPSSCLPCSASHHVSSWFGHSFITLIVRGTLCLPWSRFRLGASGNKI